MSGEVVIRDAAAGAWLRFQNPREVIETERLSEVLPCLRRVEALVRQERLYAAGFLSYEAAPAMDRALAVRESRGTPLVWFGLYSAPQPIQLQPPEPGCKPPPEWLPSGARADYEAAVAAVRECIARGETYQVNYTLRLRHAWSGDPWEFFLRLVEPQPPPYAAYVETARLAVCSASPELFFRLRGAEIVSRPMKGTAPRGRWLAEDLARAQGLAQSAKDRAENAMIVDMMRNDLGRIARVGSVQVRDLFRVERYETLWQMTSTVAAETAAPVSEILAALFPCASVTGAPKPNTMKIIAGLETAPRGIYTGTIGMIAPERQAQFNVAIRTVVIDKARGTAEYGVGGGVVWDSTPQGEYEECLLKSRILSQRRPDFSLLESMLWDAVAMPQAADNGGYFLLDEHLRRLAESAEYFAFPLDEPQVRRKLSELAAALPRVPHKVRLLVSRAGAIRCEAAPIDPRDAPDPARLELAARPVRSDDPFLYHKTTNRAVYEAAQAGPTRSGEVLLYNERGEITETLTANVVARIGGELWTPPVECGLLAGTFRARLLAEGKIRERVLPLEMLNEIDELFAINSVRKWRRATLRPRPTLRTTPRPHPPA
jgi:para-aminobenzoate synthetase/4-amino-4-deoxychorismate lyase